MIPFQVKYYNNKDPSVEMSVFCKDEVVCPQYGSFPMENTGSYGGWVTCAQNLVTLLDSLIEANDSPGVLEKQTVHNMLAKPRFVIYEALYRN